ncbi:MAG: sigma-70 family RNA polymerase sigma factor [Chloroflexi bacterium]|nr:sigma-70 family RNA polymerase sigma factor [Chloroflexota bacterium]
MSEQPASRIVFIQPTQWDTETFQKCTECKEVKKLSKFHRRGVGYQRICKSCRKAHTPSGVKRVIVLNPPELYEPLMKRIDALEPSLRAKARSYGNGDQMAADDIYGAMIDEILFKSKPTDSNQYIITRAKWAARAVVRRNRAYNALVGDESDFITDNEDVDVRVSFSLSAEDEYTAKEREAEIKSIIDQLPAEYGQIISMISLGFSQREIGMKLKITDQQVSYKIKKISIEFGTLGLSPA